MHHVRRERTPGGPLSRNVNHAVAIAGDKILSYNYYYYTGCICYFMNKEKNFI